MGWEELQKELIEAFTTDGVIGKKILSLIEREKTYGEFVENEFRGYSILSHSFLEFYANSMEFAASVWRDKKKRPTPPTYSETLLWHMGNFRNLRAIDILFRSGYPMDGFARLRILKESALYLAAMLIGITTYEKISGWDGIMQNGKTLVEKDMSAIRKKRKKEEMRVLNLMIRKGSGLPTEHLDNLKFWEGLFNEEVHGARLTQHFEHGPAVKGEETITIAPKPHQRSIAMFINRFCEICWMLHRTLPILQLKRNPFDEDWQYKWKLLDNNFKATLEEGLIKHGKKLGDSLKLLMNVKFAFGPSDSFDAIVLKGSPGTKNL